MPACLELLDEDRLWLTMQRRGWYSFNRATVQILSFRALFKQSSSSKESPLRQEHVRQIDPLRPRRHPHLHVPRRHQAQYRPDAIAQKGAQQGRAQRRQAMARDWRMGELVVLLVTMRLASKSSEEWWL